MSMSEREKARKLFAAELRERLRPEMVFDLIDYLNHALGKFGKTFSPMELAVACQWLVFSHQKHVLNDEVFGERERD